MPVTYTVSNGAYELAAGSEGIEADYTTSTNGSSTTFTFLVSNAWNSYVCNCTHIYKLVSIFSPEHNKLYLERQTATPWFAWQRCQQTQELANALANKAHIYTKTDIQSEINRDGCPRPVASIEIDSIPQVSIVPGSNVASYGGMKSVSLRLDSALAAHPSYITASTPAGVLQTSSASGAPPPPLSLLFSTARF